MSDVWTQEEEAERLAKRFAAISQAGFARRVDFPGGPSMISQHIKGRRPINLQHALAYARGFGVPLAEISPRLAMQTAEVSEFEEMRAQSSLVGALGDLDPRRAPAAVKRLQGLLQGHTATRRKVIGDLLGRLAEDPQNEEIAQELAFLLDKGPA